MTLLLRLGSHQRICPKTKKKEKRHRVYSTQKRRAVMLGIKTNLPEEEKKNEINQNALYTITYKVIARIVFL